MDHTTVLVQTAETVDVPEKYAALVKTPRYPWESETGHKSHRCGVSHPGMVAATLHNTREPRRYLAHVACQSERARRYGEPHLGAVAIRAYLDTMVYGRENSYWQRSIAVVAAMFSETQNPSGWQRHKQWVFTPTNFQTYARRRQKRSFTDGRCPLAVAGLLFLALVTFAHGAQAQIYHVAQQGDDTNSGTSWKQAWRSMEHAAKRVRPGDTVLIRKSSLPYKGIRISQSGTPDAPITFRGEDPLDPPVVSGAFVTSGWVQQAESDTWMLKEPVEPMILVFDDQSLPRKADSHCKTGCWDWKEGRLLLHRPPGNPNHRQVWQLRQGSGFVIGAASWIVLENFYCRMSKSACVSIKGGSHNTVRNLRARWSWRGVDITEGGHHNLIENCLIEDNREGITIRNGSNHNEVRRCRVYRNGNVPFWSNGDRHGVGIGEGGPNVGNAVRECEIAYNGGPNSDAALIAFRSPKSVFEDNRVHHNYGAALFITVDSHGSVVARNTIYENGREAVSDGHWGVAAVSVRNSYQVSVVENCIEDNFVSAGKTRISPYPGLHGALDITGHSQIDMTNIRLEYNVIRNTKGGPDLTISKVPNTKGLIVLHPASDNESRQEGPVLCRQRQPEH